MKKLAIGLAFLLIFIFPAAVMAGDGAAPRNTRFALGYRLHNFRHDFGFGLELTSPYFFNDRAAVRFAVGTSYFDGIPSGNTEYEWMPYSIYQLGLVGVGTMVGDLVRLYGEGGVMYIVPNRRFSEKSAFGGYGYFGFEFFMGRNHPLSYYLALGSVGSKARAEKIGGKPLYLNGLATTVGLRVHF